MSLGLVCRALYMYLSTNKKSSDDREGSRYVFLSIVDSFHHILLTNGYISNSFQTSGRGPRDPRFLLFGTYTYKIASCAPQLASNFRNPRCTTGFLTIPAWLQTSLQVWATSCQASRSTSTPFVCRVSNKELSMTRRVKNCRVSNESTSSANSYGPLSKRASVRVDFCMFLCVKIHTRGWHPSLTNKSRTGFRDPDWLPAGHCEGSTFGTAGPPPSPSDM